MHCMWCRDVWLVSGLICSYLSAVQVCVNPIQGGGLTNIYMAEWVQNVEWLLDWNNRSVGINFILSGMGVVIPAQNPL